MNPPRFQIYNHNIHQLLCYHPMLQRMARSITNTAICTVLPQLQPLSHIYKTQPPIWLGWPILIALSTIDSCHWGPLRKGCNNVTNSRWKVGRHWSGFGSAWKSAIVPNLRSSITNRCVASPYNNNNRAANDGVGWAGNRLQATVGGSYGRGRTVGTNPL